MPSVPVVRGTSRIGSFTVGSCRSRRGSAETNRQATVLPDTITVSGHVYDVTTGLVTTIIPAAPMHPRISSLTPKSVGAAPL
jgi:hypothetical protein